MKPGNKETSPSESQPHDAKVLVEYAEARAKDALRWYKVMWSQYLWLSGCGWVVAALIPFGLAFVSFYKEEWVREMINKSVLFVSAVGFSAQVLASVFRFRERAQAKMKMS